VIFHTGDTWSYKAKVKFAHPMGIDEVAVDHPDVRFVMAHLGNPWLLDAAEVISKNDNVWGDLSGFNVGDEKGLNELLRMQPPPPFLSDIQKSLWAAQRWDRLIYGSDWPLTPMPVYRAFVEAVVPREHQQKVFRENAEQLFGVRI
jgi:predicted TIM-barrel fold metal-dependent hydrolase